MGSDFSFVIVAKNECKSKIEAFINLHSDDRNSLFESADNCLCINFPLDSSILKYLESLCQYGASYPADYYIREHNAKARIGCIYFYHSTFDGLEGVCKYVFTAATSNMSFLFEESVSIRAWFVELSKQVGAMITYMDLEYNGNRIIFWGGKEIDILLKNNTHFDLTVQEFRNAIITFSESEKHAFASDAPDFC